MTHLEQRAREYARQNQERFLDQLKEFVSIASVSTDPEARSEMVRAAEWVAARLRALGVNQVEVAPTGGHPAVVGEWLGAPGQPTILIYGHYDVQPVDPLELWQSPPFTPEVRGENLYGRGASDMKGQVMAVLSALEAVRVTTGGTFPVNLKFLIEGEEEIGSPSLPKFITQNRQRLQADFCLNPDSGMLGAQYPTITYGLRGIITFELRVSGPKSDLHSGIYGGVVHNPAVALAELIAGMHDASGRVTLPGFYDDVLPITAAEHADFARLPLDDAYYLEQTGVPALWGEPEYLPDERVGARPTLEVNGLLSGFTGAGFKTVLPAQAMAKLSCRLVPKQDPAKIAAGLRQYLEQNAPRTVRWELVEFGGSPASISDVNQPGVKALQKALESVWGVQPFFKREGGSVPVVTQMQTLLGMESVITGFGLPDDNLHAPNEKLHLPTWYRGIEAMVAFLFNAAEN
ncbi:MAG: dipeptidase [Anaerolineales bacterium]|nr:dipeptidase [Anaerolineales bacterium]MCX7753814.1 dipeptidase [Anaerolineales bacterium]MDW8276410.1 dipeptidase [Anaerolineales bacterium]